MDGAYENFSLEALLEHPDFEPMDWHPEGKEGLYPLEGGFIIEPGACVQNKIEDLSLFPLHEIESPRSVDFVHLSFSWEEFPEEWQPFRELPAALAERLGARFDRAAWGRAMLCGAEIRMEQGPPCVHPLFCGSDCVAEFSLMIGMGSGEPHYEDSDTTMLRYAPCAEEAVQQLLRELAEAHPTLRRLRIPPLMKRMRGKPFGVRRPAGLAAPGLPLRERAARPSLSSRPTPPPRSELHGGFTPTPHHLPGPPRPAAPRDPAAEGCARTAPSHRAGSSARRRAARGAAR